MPENTPSMVQVDDLDTFVRALVHWHTTKVQLVERMVSLPEGAKLGLDDQPPMALQGDLLKGFRLGLAYALSELGSLPFTIEPDAGDERPLPGHDTQPATH